MRAFCLAMACLLMLTGGLPSAPSRAGDYMPPSVTAWQRSHEGHLTIEWAETARVQQKRMGDLLVLRFGYPLAPGAGSALRNLSNFIDQDRTGIDGADLSLALKPGVFSKVNIREKRIVTVDFFRDPKSRPASTIEASTIDNGIRLTLDWPEATQIDVSQNINELRLEISPARDIDPVALTKLQQTLEPWFKGLRSTQRRESTTLALVLEPQIASSVRPSGAMRTVIDLTRDASALPEPAAAPPSPVFIPEKKPQAVSIATAKTGEPGPPIPRKRPSRQATGYADGIGFEERSTIAAKSAGATPKALVIDWNKPVGAAVFIRAGHLWTVFDEPDASQLADLPASPEAFGIGTFVPVEGGTALVFPLSKPVGIRVSQTTEGQWRIEPVASSAPPNPLKIERVADSALLRVTPVVGERIVSIVDPVVGDRIEILPLRESGFGQPARRRFVDLELLPTAQGLVWRPLNDRLIADIRRNGLEFRSPGGLSLSTTIADALEAKTPAIVDAMARRETDEGRRPEPLVEERPAVMPAPPDPTTTSNDREPSSYFDLAGAGVERQLVGEYRRLRRQAIGKAAPEKRDKARLDLARLLVSERLATEARTVLNAVSDDAENHIVLQKRALRGVSAFLIGHRAEASSLLLDPGLNDDDEIDIWRAALESVENRWQTAAERWRAASDVLDMYPPRLRLDLGLMAMESAIETGDDNMMENGIRRLASLPLNPYEQAKVDAMRALKAERTGDLERARTLLTNLTDSPDPTIKTLADFKLLALDLEAEGNQPDRLAALDRRTPLWRGHPDEPAMLDELARRFKDANAMRKALTTWERLVQLYPETANDEGLNRARQETFMQALANRNRPAIDLLDVYAIYLDFIDLVPDDPESRDVHRHLARHLTSLDLLDPAIDLLQSLMASSVDDVERAELAAELAALMLQQNRATPALAVLDSTDKPAGAFSPALEEARRLVRARALAGLGRTDDALRAIRDLQSPAAQKSRASILWDERRWPRLAASIESYFADREPASPLTEDDQELVLWLALARQKEGASARLDALRERFGDAMRSGDHAEAFDVATQRTVETSNIEALLAATESQLAELQRFRQATPASR